MVLHLSWWVLCKLGYWYWWSYENPTEVEDEGEIEEKVRGLSE